MSPMNRRTFTKAMLAGATMSAITPKESLARSSGRDERPNIVYVFTDQQYAQSMSCTGNHDVNTPAMDSIAQNGVRFDNAYCTFPLCTPSRGSMFTGKMPHELGITHNVMPLPEEGRQQEMGWLFRNAGYETAYAGKWHLPKQLMDEGHGFEILCEMNDTKATDKSIEFIKRDHDKPFLLATSYFQPHGCCPLHRFEDPRLSKSKVIGWPDDKYEQSFLDRCPELPENFAVSEPRPEVITEHRNRYKTFEPGKRPKFWAPEEDFNAARNWTRLEIYRYYRWAYYRIVEWVDEQIGQILQALRETGLDKNTLVVFSSDHGDMMGAHGLIAKNYFYDESAKIPLVMSLPGHMKENHVVSSPLVCNGLDLLPTLCDYAGVEVPEGLQGRSLRDLAEGREPREWRDHLVMEVGSDMAHGRCVHNGRFKYTVYEEGENPEELFDIVKDPGEMHNLIGSGEHAGVIKECKTKLAAWRKQTNDRVPELVATEG